MCFKNCSKCGKGFECLADSRGCWCESYTLSTDTLTALRSSYANCLCAQCLGNYETTTTEAGTASSEVPSSSN